MKPPVQLAPNPNVVVHARGCTCLVPKRATHLGMADYAARLTTQNLSSR